MQRSSKLFGFALAAAGLYLAIGCTSTTTGNEGNLDFSYFADDDIRNFNKPVAVGAKLELTVKQTGTGANVTLQDASSDDNEVLAIESFSGDKLIVEGKGVGSAAIEVSANVPGGDTVTDSVNMLGAIPDVLEMAHTCAQNAKYFVDTAEIMIGYDFKKSNGQDVIGYGYFPFDLVGDDTLTLDATSKDQAFWHFAVGSTPGTTTITSTIDDSTLEVGVVLPEDVDGLDQGGGTNLAVDVASTRYVLVYPTVAGDRVCQSKLPITATSNTPSICAVRVVPPIEADEVSFGSYDNIAVDGVAPGTCDYSVTFPDGDGGAGVTGNFTLEVE